MVPKVFRNGLVYLLLLTALAAFVFTSFSRTRPDVPEVAIADLAREVTAGLVQRIAIKGNELQITYKPEYKSTTAIVRKEDGISLGDTLKNLGVPDDKRQAIVVEVVAPSRWENWGAILGTLLPLVLVGAFFFFLMRQAQGAGNQAFAFGKSRARMFTGEKPTVTFADVAGADEAKEELQEVVEFLKEPQKFAALGARIPKGVLLIGSPGTGKTLMAKAVSGEAGVPFFSISGSEFVEMFVGVGASRVRDLFEQAKRSSPCIVFIDEIDAVGRHRGAGLGGSHDHCGHQPARHFGPRPAASRSFRSPGGDGSAGHEGAQGHPGSSRQGQTFASRCQPGNIGQANAGPCRCGPGEHGE